MNHVDQRLWSIDVVHTYLNPLFLA